MAVIPRRERRPGCLAALDQRGVEGTELSCGLAPLAVGDRDEGDAGPTDGDP